MQGPHRNLDCEGGCKRNEKPELRPRVYAALRDQIRDREASLIDSQPEDGKQHQDRACHRVQEELERRIDASWAAPDADQEVHRHQRELPEDVEQEQVLRDEYARHADFQQQEEDHELAHPGIYRLPGGEDRDRREERRQQYQ